MARKLMAIALAAAMAVAVSAPARAGEMMIRVLGTAVITQDNVNSLTSNGTNVLGTYDAEVSNEFIPAATISYFFNKNIAVELFCCFATHQIDIKGAADGEIADFWIFPPALTLQYHFTHMGPWKPYVGVGLQYIHFFDQSTGANRIAASKVDIDDAFGFTLQAGMDIAVGKGWYFNVDVKKTWLSTEARWSNSAVGEVHADVDIDPLIISAGIGYKFNVGDLFGRRQTRYEPMK